MIKKFKIGITPFAFTKNSFLVKEIEKHDFAEIRLNKTKYPLDGNDLIDFLRDLDGSIIGREIIDENILFNSPKIKVLSKYGVGLDNIDSKACRDNGVDVLFSQGVNRRSVAELTLGFMIGLLRDLYQAADELKEGRWNRKAGHELTGKTIGIIGVGNIGKDIVELLKYFKCRILVNDIINQDNYYKEKGLIESSKEQIFGKADIVTIHTPLTELTRNMVNKNILKTMKKSAFLINTARGEIVIQEDLKWALKNGIIAGSAIDVYEMEPPEDKAFLELENLICTPHIGGHAEEAIEAMGQCAIKNLVDFFMLKGRVK